LVTFQVLGIDGTGDVSSLTIEGSTELPVTACTPTNYNSANQELTCILTGGARLPLATNVVLSASFAAFGLTGIVQLNIGSTQLRPSVSAYPLRDLAYALTSLPVEGINFGSTGDVSEVIVNGVPVPFTQSSDTLVMVSVSDIASSTWTDGVSISVVLTAKGGTSDVSVLGTVSTELDMRYL
jgi:hypothetical protein